MLIPKRFKLWAKTIDVVFDNQLSFREDAKGHAAFRENLIRIQPSSENYPREQTSIEKTFCHELVHHILNEMEENELGGNEKFVGLFAGFLHQALNTFEYEKCQCDLCSTL